MGAVLERILSGVAAGWNLLLLVLTILTLGGFLYGIYFRRALRARRIAHLRERRLLREAAERQASNLDK